MASAARRAPLLRAPGFPRTPPSHGRGRSSRRGQPSLAVSQGRGLHRKEDAYEVPLRDLLGVLEELQVLTPPVVARLEPAVVDWRGGPALNVDAHRQPAGRVVQAHCGKPQLLVDGKLHTLLWVEVEGIPLSLLAAVYAPSGQLSPGERVWQHTAVWRRHRFHRAHRPALLEVFGVHLGPRVEPAAVATEDDPALHVPDTSRHVLRLAPHVQPLLREVHAQLSATAVHRRSVRSGRPRCPSGTAGP
mmetsp:Transcript_14120/g.44374  ORF Transcript_14120/g.44374 Transcript_14120/m.44374 type:complete len:246 (+) Transcript_14120:319-1056(+)